MFQSFPSQRGEGTLVTVVLSCFHLDYLATWWFGITNTEQTNVKSDYRGIPTACSLPSNLLNPYQMFRK